MRPEPRRRFVHLGERLRAIARVRAGEASLESAAAELGVAPGQLLDWIATHATERLHSLEELRASASPEVRRLAERARRLEALIAAADRDLRELHQEYILALATRDLPADANKFG